MVQVYMREGEYHKQSQPNTAINCYQDALQLIKKMPKEQTTQSDIDMTVKKLETEIEACKHGAVKKVSTFNFSVKSDGQEARELLAGLNSFPQAIGYFAQLPYLVNLGLLREKAIESLNEYTFKQDIPLQIKSEDWRNIGHVPPYNSNSSDNEEPIRYSMREMYYHQVINNVTSFIMPALQQIKEDHAIDLSILEVLCEQSSFVPPKRHKSMSRILFYGFHEDFITTTHIIGPQIEHAIRYKLKQLGVTTIHTEEGIETEIGMSSLVKKPEFEQLFTESLRFEICSIFTEKMGINFRNNIAHGLLDDEMAENVAAIYAWWLCLRLIVLEAQ
jgi:hypothetical protein